MRTEPLVKKKADYNKVLIPILKIIAILVAFVSVFIFYIKLLFL